MPELIQLNLYIYIYIAPLDIPVFLGHFHPLLVHLPIGFLVLAVLFQALAGREKYRALQAAVPLTLLAGTISAALACMTGWILSTTDGYDPATLNLHKWTALSIPFLSLFAWLMSIQKLPAVFPATRRSLLITLIGMTGVLTVAGHIGATLTHGPGYLSFNTAFDNPEKKQRPASIDQAMVFDDLVQPILQNKCGSCHNSAKMKGRLSMATLASLVKGGKHGPVIVPGQPAASEMIKRISLDPANDKFMPTDGKTPLNADEAAFLKWWIEKVAGNADRKWADPALQASLSPAIKAYGETVFKTSGPSGKENFAHGKSPGSRKSSGADPAADAAASIKAPPLSKEKVTGLQQAGFVIKYISLDPVLLDVTLPSLPASPPGLPLAPSKSSQLSQPVSTRTSPPSPVPNRAIVSSAADKLKELLSIKDNIVWLNLSGNNISDDQLESLAQYKNLRRLKLEKNPITDKGIAKLRGLDRVETINLYDTRITKNCLASLAGMKSLRSAYVWGTGIKKEEIPKDNADTSSNTGLRIITGH